GYIQQNENEKKQLLIQKQKSLHKMKVALDTFYNVLEPLEEYIEKSGNYPGFIAKRQIYRKSIQDSEGSLENDEDLFLSDLYIFARTFHGKPEFFMKVIQEDFYKWINAVGITAENTSEELKHFLIEINNVLEGNDEKIVKETREKIKNIEVDPKEMVGIFAGLQNPLNKNRQRFNVCLHTFIVLETPLKK
ncbi:4016_t:CDS:1, partial [Gigaspora margarita]